MAQADDLKAIDDLFRRTTPTTSQQSAIQSDWRRWYDGLSWYDRNVSGAILTEAKKRKDLFNAARNYPLAPAKVQDMPASNVVVPVTAGPKPVLRKGAGRGNLASQKPFVMEWQRILGFTGPDVDGDFWTMTDKATRAWQKDRGLTVDGVVGQQSWGRAAQEATLAAVKPAPIAQAAQQAAVAVQAQAAKPAPKPAPKPAAKPAPKPAPKPTVAAATQAANMVAPQTTSTAKPPAKPPTATPASTTKEKAKAAITKTKAAVQETAAQAQATVYDMPLWLKLVGGGVLAVGGFKLGSAAVRRATK